nr:MAG: capsid protein [Cressdnaviricota sp.]
MTRSVAQRTTRNSQLGAIGRAAASGLAIQAGKYLGKTLGIKKTARVQRSDSGRSLGAITYQKDSKTLYKSKKMTKGKSKVLRRRKRERMDALHNSPAKHVISNYIGSITATGAGFQTMSFLPSIYTWGGTNSVVGQQDCYSLLNNFAPSSISSATTGATSGTATGLEVTTNLYDSTVYVESAHADYFLTNASSNNIFCDVYEVVSRRDDDGYVSLGSYIQVDQVDAAVTVSGASNIGYQLLGSTPFQLDKITKNWKILNKTRYFMQTSESIAFSLHDKRMRTIKGQDFDTYTSYRTKVAKKGYTKGFIVVFFAAPSGGAEPSSGNLTYSVTKTYKVKVDSTSLPTTGTTYSM